MTAADLDRGAVAALDLLKRGWETQEGEDSIEETAETIRGAVAADGLAVVIRRQIDFERDFLTSVDDEFDAERDYGPFPAGLADLARDIPRTEWRGKAS